MNFKEIQTAVQREIEHFSAEFFTDIPAVINEVYEEACDMIDPGVPNLQDTETLGTSITKAFINEPALSSGKITDIYNKAGDKLIQVQGDLETLRDKCGSLSRVGGIKYWLHLGTRIWYAPIPSASDDLEIIFYKRPTALAGDGDKPVEIPNHLHRSVLVHGTAVKLFSRIEQEGENEALETAKQLAFFKDGSDKFSAWIARRQRIKGRTAWDA